MVPPPPPTGCRTGLITAVRPRWQVRVGCSSRKVGRRALPSLLLIARSELRTRLGGILLIGLLAGLTGAMVLGTGTVARRASTANARLGAASHVDDVRMLVFGGTPTATRSIGSEAL